MLVRDIERMRASLDIPAFERVRVLIGASDGKLGLELECIACEELLEWDVAKGWWVCPVCQHETTDKEGGDLLRACYKGLGEVLGETDDGEKDEDEGGGVGRWLRRLTRSSP